MRGWWRGLLGRSKILFDITIGLVIYVLDLLEPSKLWVEDYEEVANVSNICN